MDQLFEFETLEEFHEMLEGEDELGAAIRGHLGLERYLNAILEKITPDNKYLKKLNLEFEKKVWLAVCLGMKPSFARTLLAVNTLRNKFAHSLETSFNLQLINNFYKGLGKEDKKLVQQAFQKTQRQTGFYPGKKFSQIPPKARFIMCMVAFRTLLVKTLNEAHERKLKGEY